MESHNLEATQSQNYCRFHHPTFGLADIVEHSTPASWGTKFPKTFDEGFLRNAIRKDRIVHGSMYLPPGYMLAFLPSNAIIETSFSGELADISIASSYNLLKALVGIIQVCFSSVTIYQTRGDQVERYGYAAFGLTVIPYAIMSIVNLLGNLLTPDFPTLYMVKSPEMTEAEDPKRGGWFDGVVGVVKYQQQNDGRSVQFTETEDGFLVHEVEQPPIVDVLKKDAGRLHGTKTSSAIFASTQSKNASPSPPDLELVRMKNSSGDLPSHSGLSSTSQIDFTNNQWSTQVAADTQEKTPTKLFYANYTWKIFPGQTSSSGVSFDMTFPSTKQPEDDGPETRLLPPPISRRIRCNYYIRLPSASNLSCEGAQAWGMGRLTQWALLSFIMASIPFAIISSLTHFQKGKSTFAQRVWTMTWLVMGTFWGSTLPSIFKLIKEFEFKVHEIVSNDEQDTFESKTAFWGLRMSFLLTCAVFAIGGYVVVGQMLSSYGNCVKLT